MLIVSVQCEIKKLTLKTVIYVSSRRMLSFSVLVKVSLRVSV